MVCVLALQQQAQHTDVAAAAAAAAGQLQAALSDYQSALQQTPTNSVLYANIALVQLKLGAINEVGGQHTLPRCWSTAEQLALVCVAWLRCIEPSSH
jgi:PPE-repeat protein